LRLDLDGLHYAILALYFLTVCSASGSPLGGRSPTAPMLALGVPFLRWQWWRPLDLGRADSATDPESDG
jgi:hypothetical protein